MVLPPPNPTPDYRATSIPLFPSFRSHILFYYNNASVLYHWSPPQRRYYDTIRWIMISTPSPPTIPPLLLPYWHYNHHYRPNQRALFTTPDHLYPLLSFVLEHYPMTVADAALVGQLSGQ